MLEFSSKVSQLPLAVKPVLGGKDFLKVLKIKLFEKWHCDSTLTCGYIKERERER